MKIYKQERKRERECVLEQSSYICKYLCFLKSTRIPTQLTPQKPSKFHTVFDKHLICIVRNIYSTFIITRFNHLVIIK